MPVRLSALNDDGRLTVDEHGDGLTQRGLPEVPVAAVSLERILVVVELEDLEDGGLLGILMGNVRPAARLLA